MGPRRSIKLLNAQLASYHHRLASLPAKSCHSFSLSARSCRSIVSESLPLSRHSQPAISLGPCLAFHHDASVAQLLVRLQRAARAEGVARRGG
jgi:hypothetical protein